MSKRKNGKSKKRMRRWRAMNYKNEGTAHPERLYDRMAYLVNLGRHDWTGIGSNKCAYILRMTPKQQGDIGCKFVPRGNGWLRG